MAIVAVALVVVAAFLASGRLFHKTSTIAPRDYTRKVATGNFKTRSLSVAAPGLLETFSIFYPAELATSDRKYPVVVFANASGVVASQYDAVLPYIEEKRLDKWTHNKTIQKAVESYRITPEQKDHLRSLRIK